MDLFFGGTEQKMWRTLLQNEGVDHVSLSYIGLRRRIKDPSSWRIAEHFEGQKVFLDSGAFTLNKAEDIDPDEAYDLAQMYMDFVDANIDSIEFASEFDAQVLGKDLIWQLRADYWQQLPEDKWMPVWHSETGTKELERLAGTYARVGVLQDETLGDLTPMLRRLAGRTKLHGVAMTRMESMEEIPWDSVGSTSWLSPTQYGDTFVWTGRELKRYPKRYKDQARKRHRTWLADQGFDMGLIEADDNGELLRLSIWSWNKFAASLRKGGSVPEAVGTLLDETEQSSGVTTDHLDPFGQNAERPGSAVDIPQGDVRNGELVPSRPKKLLPVLGVTRHTHTDADGNEVEETRFSTPASGLLRCNNCFMREKCPEMVPDSDCAFEIPAQVRTGSQMAAVQDWLIETQTQRVAFMRMVEQAEGGYADANTSTEMDRLQKMLKAKTDAGKDGFSINIANVTTPAEARVIGNVFGEELSGRMGALPAAVDTNDIIDAQIVE